MSSTKKNRPKKTMSLYEWQRQNQKQQNKPVGSTVSTSKKPAHTQSSGISKSNQPAGTVRRGEKFHNPYHFVPAKKDGKADDLCITTFDGRQLNHVTHDRYVDNTHSGKLICRLTSKTPFFVGDERKEDAKEDSPAEVSPYMINDKPAIPATSLRGLISSIAEASSNSALRVLEERHYSYRMEMRNSLGAIGMIVEEKRSDGKVRRRLRPLALPSLPWRNHYATLPSKLRTLFTKPLLKVYLNGYKENPVQTGTVQYIIDSFLQKQKPKSYSSDNKQDFWYIKIKSSTEIRENRIICTAPHIKEVRTRDGRVFNYINGQSYESLPVNQEAFDKLSSDEKFTYTRGIIRVLGIEGREDQIPTSKTHEIFIPYPEWMEEEPTFDCEDAARHFESLAADRTKGDINLPFHTKGSERNKGIKDKEKSETYNIQLRDGDIIFFRPDEHDPTKVAEVSISSIWRRSAGGTSHDYFRTISPELLPFNPKRKTITLAEQLFGFVEQDFSSDKSQLKDRQARGLASRLRFSPGLFQHWEQGKDNGSNHYLPPVTLKILDSPKPPSPSLYFKRNNGRGAYISKQELSPQKHHPQGRKFYLHQADKDKKSWAVNPPWATAPQPSNPCRKEDRCQQKVKITPIKDGSVFYFHIDFDNLSDLDLGLLLYSLSPSNDFHHKLGMGKPIGLGTVKIEPIGLFTINRKERYSVKTAEDIFVKNGQRYHNGWVKDKDDITLWQILYPQEVIDYRKGLKLIDYTKLRQTFADKIDNEIQKALELLGNPDNVNVKVHYPQLKGEDIEKENFRWFVENEKTKKQGLKPLDKNSPGLPPLNGRF